jgi:Arc/MetJ-type ribon-helix-helix transcriptional regulator
MSYLLPQILEQMVQERMAARGYNSEDEVLLDAMLALEDIDQRREDLRSQIQRRVESAGSTLALPLDRASFKAEARRRLTESR